MKKVILIITLVLTTLLTAFGVYTYQQRVPVTDNSAGEHQDSSSSLSTQIITHEIDTISGSVGYNAIYVKDPLNISLIPNFDTQHTAEEIHSEHACDSGINGGFYDVDDSPIGLFVSDGSKISEARTNALFDGFLWLGTYGSFGITTTVPDIPIQHGIQTGPIVYFASEPRLLDIKDDRPARRMIAAITDTNSLVFLALYDPESVFSGPLLGDVPNILTSVATSENITITSAINLDGGSASAFYSHERKLSELSPIGSFFCISE